MDFVAVDFETANEQRNSACAIGLTMVTNGQVTETAHYLIRPPELRFANWNTRIHGLREEDVRNCPKFAELWSSIEPIFTDSLVVAHNASFDMSVLRHALYEAELCPRTIRYLCSLNVARQAWPHLISHSLGFLAETFNIELDHHDAGSDSQAAAKLMMLAAKEKGVNCPFALADDLLLSIGEIWSSSGWVPSSAPSVRSNIEAIELTLPEGYDISRHPFHGTNVVFTGKLTTLRRDEAHQIVRVFGGNPQKGVTRQTKILVVGIQDIRQMARGETESSKLRKVRQLKEQGLDIQIITDQDFEQLVFHPDEGNDKSNAIRNRI